MFRGWSGFLVILAGHVVSALGSGISGFAVAVWIYEGTSSVTAMALSVLGANLPNILVSPLAGTIVDRFDRRRVMMTSRVVCMGLTLAMAGLFFSGNLDRWTAIFLVALSSMANAFQPPALSASIPRLVPGEKLGRAAGLSDLGRAIPAAGAPLLSGALIQAVGLGWTLMIDAATFVFALVTLALVPIPHVEEDEKAPAERGFRLALPGWEAVRAHAGLTWLFGIRVGAGFLMGFAHVLLMPLLLSVTSPAVMGRAVSAAGLGLFLGSVRVARFGVPEKKVRAILICLFLGSVLTAAMGLRPSTWWITGAAFLVLFLMPTVSGSGQVLWQTKVRPDFHGRVFALLNMGAQTSATLAYVAAGPLADRVFEPAMAAGGRLAGSVGPLLGVGEGRGIGLMFVVVGTLSAVMAGLLAAVPSLRRIEAELPDVGQRRDA